MTCVCVLARARMSACAGGREKEGELLGLLVAGRLGAPSAVTRCVLSDSEPLR